MKQLNKYVAELAPPADGSNNAGRKTLTMKRQRAALHDILALCKQSANVRVLALHPHLLHHLIQVAQTVEDFDMEEISLAIIGSISMHVPNQRLVFEYPQMLAMLMDKAKNGGTSEMQWKSWWVLSNLLSEEEANQRAAFLQPGLLELAINASKRGSNRDIRGLALSVLVGMSCHDENARAMFTAPGLVAVLLDTMERCESVLNKEEASRTFTNLARNAENRADMRANARFMHEVEKSVLQGESEEIKFHCGSIAHSLKCNGKHGEPGSCCGGGDPASAPATTAALPPPAKEETVTSNHSTATAAAVVIEPINSFYALKWLDMYE